MSPHDALRRTRPRPDPRLAEVLDGLQRQPRRLSAKWFYDAAGSRLFDRITELPEYYLTRTELAILERALPEVAAIVGEGLVVHEPGAGSGLKTELLLGALAAPRAYTAIDVSGAALAANAARLRARFPDLALRTLVEDFTGPGVERARFADSGDALVFFPGSTLGNFEPEAAIALLRRFRRLAGRRGRLLLGADLAKDPALLLPAYDDAAGVTAAFNRNALAHLNAALGADFVPERFAHRVRFDPVESRIEMHLESTVDQQVALGGTSLALAAGERIHTENSYKHPLPRLLQIAAAAGWVEQQRWSDPEGWFGVFLFGAAAPAFGRGTRAPEGPR